MSRFNSIKGLAVATVLLGCGVFSGCMTAPYSGQLISKRSDKISASGFVTQANKTIIIQCRKSQSSAWETIGWTSSGSYPIQWDGVTWYSWSKSNLVVPNACWNKFFAGYATEFRAVMNGSPLYTFNASFSDCWSPDTSVGEMWDDCGAGNSVLIFAED